MTETDHLMRSPANAQRLLESRLELENEELKRLVRAFYWWVIDQPVKHPQQAEWRERARKFIDARADAD